MKVLFVTALVVGDDCDNHEQSVTLFRIHEQPWVPQHEAEFWVAPGILGMVQRVCYDPWFDNLLFDADVLCDLCHLHVTADEIDSAVSNLVDSGWEVRIPDDTAELEEDADADP